MRLTDYIEGDVRGLLATPPFSGWEVTRSAPELLPSKEVWYQFEGRGVEVICDETERIRTIFIRRGEAEGLCEISFSLTRREVLERFGSPSKSGAAKRVRVLGDKGAWDRFDLPTASIHVQYRLDRDEIDMITYMSPATAP